MKWTVKVIYMYILNGVMTFFMDMKILPASYFKKLPSYKLFIQ